MKINIIKEPVRRPEDAMCCPSVRKYMKYEWKYGEYYLIRTTFEEIK